MLSLESNKFIGDIPEFDATKMTSLADLRLRGNMLNGTIPSSMYHLTALEYLEMSFLDESIALALVFNPTEVVAAHNPLPTDIGRLTQLTNLLSGGLNMTGTIPTEIGLLTTIKNLGIPAAYLTGTIPSEIGLLSELRGLLLSTNYLTGQIPSELGQLFQLKIVLSDNLLTGTVPWQLASNRNLST